MKRDGAGQPAQFDSDSELQPGLAVYYEAYWQLHTTRQIGMGVGPIPHPEIIWFCKLREYDEETAATMEHHIRAMDNAYLEHVSKDQAKKLKNGRR